MRQISTAFGLSLFLHVLLFSMISGWEKKKSEIRMQPQFITVVLSYDQKKTIVPMQVRKPEDFEKISIPNKKNDKKKQITPPPKRDIQRSVQTRITSDLSKKVEAPVRLTESQKAEPERKIQKKVEPVSVRAVKHDSLTEQIQPGMHEFPDIYMTPGEEDNRQTALYEGEGNLLSPANQGMQIVMPYYKKNPTPPYPEIARRRGDQGIVMLKVLVNQEGKADEILLFQSSGHSVLDRAALVSVKNWFFEPGKKGGETVKMWVTVPIKFKIK